MKFEDYTGTWLDNQNLIKSTRKTTRQALDIYILPVIGSVELEDITEGMIDQIFTSERLFERKGANPSQLDLSPCLRQESGSMNNNINTLAIFSVAIKK